MTIAITKRMLETYNVDSGKIHKDRRTAELEFEFTMKSSMQRLPDLRVFSTFTVDDEFLTRIHTDASGFIMREGVRKILKEKLNEVLLHWVYRGMELVLRRQEG